MRQHSILSAWAWFVVPLFALGFTFWGHSVRIDRIDHLAELSRGESVPSDTSLTGYVGGIRERVLSDHDNNSYEWIAQTQRMLATGEGRIRWIDQENAPFGRETHAASPYRWWLGAVAASIQVVSGDPWGMSVERAAIYADPLLHLLIVAGLVLFTVRFFGPPSAAFAGVAAAGLFPFAARFLPGVPDDSVFSAVCVVGSVLPLVVGVRREREFEVVSGRSEDGGEVRFSVAATRWFCIAGVMGGLGFWLSPTGQMPVLIGIALSALWVAWTTSRAAVETPSAFPRLWRMWSLSGAITVLIAYLAEYFPHHLGAWEIRAVHPMYGLCWLGMGELIARSTEWIQGKRRSWNFCSTTCVLLALLAISALPVVMHLTHNPGFLAVESQYYRLLNQPGAIMAPNVMGWFHEQGFSRATLASFLPVLWLIPAFAMVAGRKSDSAARAEIAVTLGPAIALLCLACFQIKQWLLLDAALLALLIPTLHAVWATDSVVRRSIWSGGAAAALALGVIQLAPAKGRATDNVMSLSEALGLAERDLAHWLAKRGGRTTPLVLAPPATTTSLAYYGGLRGVATLSWENQEGLAFAIRTAISTSRNETAALLRQRGVTYIVMPSWDSFFDSYLQSASVQVGEMFYAGLNNWALPLWLRAVPYQLPSIPGFENQSVRVFEVVEDQDPPAAAARLMEYFIEMDRMEHAQAYHQVLLKFPADLGVQIARAHLWAAVGDAEKFSEVVEPLLGRLKIGADRYLPWDRRVSLAIVLARGNQMDLARAQTERCLADITETRLRSLTTHSLYRFLAMTKLFGWEISDAELRRISVELLPTALRKEFE